MENKFLIFGIIGFFLLINSMRPPVLANELIRCQDYTYNVNLNHVPTKITFYILEDGKEELFKEVPATQNFNSIILHCGHKYKVIYSSESYKDYEEIINIGDSMPSSISDIKDINLMGDTQ